MFGYEKEAGEDGDCGNIALPNGKLVNCINAVCLLVIDFIKVLRSNLMWIIPSFTFQY